MLSNAPFRAPDRPPQKLRPLKAFTHFRKLVADKEDTAQVFYMADCLPSRRYVNLAERFCASALGQSLMTSEPYLPDILDDHETLLAMPEGSVAHAYVAFMRREGLSAAGLVEASAFPGIERHPDQLQWFTDRLRDLHDLAHILTGYGRDALGEQCVLGFTSAQYHDLTEWFIAWIGALEFQASIKSDAPVFRAVGEARRHGAASAKIYEQDVRALLAEPLEAARARMGIGRPTQYENAHRRLRAKGLDPYALLAAA
ncbi:Coq4 family protein [Caulobacter sp. KR2-114]|uniref:Coq4 family protein n=1 Tax=Caulobacter sp. KR2-114 TaxID=3400912 RepID=UPI003C10B010